MKKRIGSVIKSLLKVFLVLVLTILLFECCYRWYIIDFYGFAWKGLNPPEIRNTKKADLLVFGDSFSASDKGYVSLLQKAFPDKIIVNASCAGIGIKQLNLFAAKRIRQTNPKAILIQVYTGNDLIDIKNLSTRKQVSFVRGLYWTISDWFMSLGYLNQRLGAFRRHETNESLHLDQSFSAEFYDKRTRLFINADPTHIDKSVTLQDDFLPRYLDWKDEMTELLKKIPRTTKTYIAFIPHCAQVNDFYYNNMKILGASFNNKTNFTESGYAFYRYAVNDFSEHPNVVFLNPLPFIAQSDSSGHRLYFENDPHFSALGNEKFANYLKPIIFKN